MGTKDPDTKEKKVDYKNEVINELNSLKDFGIPVTRLVWDDLKKELFHDRFIIIKNNKMEKIFMLSNSINNLLKSYDFCLVALEGDIKRKSLAYISTLECSCKKEDRVYPEVKKC
jgi:hypothetical protein